MYEALVARVRYHIQKANFMGLKEAESTLLLGEAADAIEELSKRVDESIPKGDADIIIVEVAKPRWIPVTERLPDVFKHVLVNIPGMSPHPTVQEAFREKNGMWYTNGFRYEAGDITNWMPLPEPPKEE